MPSPAASADQADRPASPSDGLHPLLRWVVRQRLLIFSLIALLYVASFNGQWRIGRDSSLYRGVGRNLAEGKGFTFNGKRERHAYPGLPLLLAGLDKVFGHDIHRPIPALLLMAGMAAATLVIIYRLISTHFAPWIAVTVTSGVAINWRFLQQSHELMTDTPFVLGVCAALLGFERLRLGNRRQIIWGICLSAGGLALAAVMRPTFWFLAAAWGIACCWGLLRGPARIRYALALSVLLLPAIGFITLDPRTRAASFRSGRYEEDAARAVSELGSGTWWPRLVKTLDAHFTEILFGTTLLPGLNALLSLAFILAGVWLIRRVPLWGLLVAITVIATYLLGSSVPRYYLMILPLVLLGWTLVVDAVLRRIAAWPRAHYASLAVIFLGFTCISIANVVKDLGLVAEQHGLTTSGRRPFLETYRGGRMLRIAHMARALPLRVRPDARTLGPEPRVMSYLSGRRVFALADELRDSQVKALSRALRRAGDGDKALLRGLADQLKGRLRFDYAVFPARAYEAHLDPLAKRLIALRIIRTRFGKKMARTGGWWLGKVEISRDGGRPQFRAPKGLRGPALKELEKRKRQEDRAQRKLRRQQRLQGKPPATAPALHPNQLPMHADARGWVFGLIRVHRRASVVPFPSGPCPIRVSSVAEHHSPGRPAPPARAAGGCGRFFARRGC